ncbi:MAG: DUF4397 domain-containing protein [Lachnospiraceae bacterium]|nr:DUF4397 domain-containing protein [Lachnospiraceae bacterium]
MDYSKTHYYKYTAPTAPKQTRSSIPVFEQDDVPATPGEGPAGSATPDLNDNIGSENNRPSNRPSNRPAAPDEGPLGTQTPSLPSTPSNPSFPFPPVGGGSTTTPSRPNNNNNNVFWSYTWLTPIFGNSSVSSVAQARFYNVNAMLEPVDIYINGQLVASDLDYSEYTDYLYIIPGYYNVTIFRRTNPGYPFISTRVNFVRNSVCTISLIGTVDSPGLQFIC